MVGGQLDNLTGILFLFKQDGPRVAHICHVKAGPECEQRAARGPRHCTVNLLTEQLVTLGKSFHQRLRKRALLRGIQSFANSQRQVRFQERAHLIPVLAVAVTNAEQVAVGHVEQVRMRDVVVLVVPIRMQGLVAALRCERVLRDHVLQWARFDHSALGLRLLLSSSLLVEGWQPSGFRLF